MNPEKFNAEVYKALVEAIEGRESTITFSGGPCDGADLYGGFTLTSREKVGRTGVLYNDINLSWWRDKVVTKCISTKEQSSQYFPYPDEITVTITPQPEGFYAEIKQHWYCHF